MNNNKYYYKLFCNKPLNGVIKKDNNGNLIFDKIKKEDCYFEEDINNINKIKTQIEAINEIKDYIKINDYKIILTKEIIGIDLYDNNNLIKSVFTDYIYTYDIKKLQSNNEIKKLNNYLFIKNNYYELNYNVNKIILYDDKNNIIGDYDVSNKMSIDQNSIIDLNDKIDKLVILLNYALSDYGINIKL